MSSVRHTGKRTALFLTKRGKVANDRLLFGQPYSSEDSSPVCAIQSFEPGKTFGFVRWRGDEYGTQTWRVVVAEAGAPGERLTKIPGIKPGAHLLLHAFGKVRAKRALRAIDALSDSHVLHEITPAYWRHVHLHVACNLSLEPHDPEAFAAMTRAKSVQ